MIRADIDAVIGKAESQLGTSESPPHSNRTKYGQWYGMNGVAWCAIFVSWVFWHAGYPLPKIGSSKGFAYVPDIVDWAKRNGKWSKIPKRGYLVVFSFGGRRPDHVGIVRRVLDDGRVETIEGNTNSGGSRTGGWVARLNRKARIVGYVVVDPVGVTVAPKPPTPPPLPPALPPLEDDMHTWYRTNSGEGYWVGCGLFRVRVPEAHVLLAEKAKRDGTLRPGERVERAASLDEVKVRHPVDLTPQVVK